MGLVSAVMALGVNLQWGFAGLFNVGVMGFVALGGLAAVLVSQPPVAAAWAAGGPRILAGLAFGALVIAAAILLWKRMASGRARGLALVALLVVGFFAFRAVLDPGVRAVEAVNSAPTGYLGGLGLPILLAWPVGGLLAAGAAWIIGKTALGLRSDYLAIATLGIAEIVIAVLKNEDWLARGVKNVIGLPRPVPYEVDLQRSASFAESARSLGLDPVAASGLWVKLNYGLLFAAVLVVVFVLAQLALKSPWGRMMRAIRDNETAAARDGQGRHPPPPAGLHPRLGGLRHGRGDDDHARRPAHAGLLPAPALHLPGLGDGDRRRLGQQSRRGARRLPDLVPLGAGGTARAPADDDDHRAPARRRPEIASPRLGRPHQAADDGGGASAGAAVQPPGAHPRALKPVPLPRSPDSRIGEASISAASSIAATRSSEARSCACSQDSSALKART